MKVCLAWSLAGCHMNWFSTITTAYGLSLYPGLAPKKILLTKLGSTPATKVANEPQFLVLVWVAEEVGDAPSSVSFLGQRAASVLRPDAPVSLQGAQCDPVARLCA